MIKPNKMKRKIKKSLGYSCSRSMIYAKRCEYQSFVSLEAFFFRFFSLLQQSSRQREDTFAAVKDCQGVILLGERKTRV